MRVVESLEVIEVDHDDRQLMGVAPGPIDLLLELGQDRLAVEHAGELVDGGQRPDLGQALGELAEAGPQTRILDTAGVGQVAGIGRRSELVHQLGDTPRLAPDHGEREAGRSQQGADQRDGHGCVGQDRLRREMSEVRHDLAILPGHEPHGFLPRIVTRRASTHHEPKVPVRSAAATSGSRCQFCRRRAEPRPGS